MPKPVRVLHWTNIAGPQRTHSSSYLRKTPKPDALPWRTRWPRPVSRRKSNCFASDTTGPPADNGLDLRLGNGELCHDAVDKPAGALLFLSLAPESHGGLPLGRPVCWMARGIRSSFRGKCPKPKPWRQNRNLVRTSKVQS